MSEPRTDDAAAKRMPPVFDCALVLASLLVGALLYLYYVRHHPPVDVDEEQLRAMREPFLPGLRHHVRPEPGERQLYQLGLVFVAVVPVTLYAALRRLLLSSRFERAARHLASPTSAVVQGWLLLAAVSTWLVLVSRESDFPSALARWPEAAGMAALIAISTRVVIPRWKTLRWGVLALFGFVAYRLTVCTDALFADHVNGHHFDVLLGAVNQVAHGRTILVDTSSQYGIAYPYIVAALVRPFGTSFMAISATFAILGLVALGFVYAVIRRASRDVDGTPCAELVFIAVVASTMSYFIASIFHIAWIYYQYFPLRTVWGCFFFWYAGTYVRATGERRTRLGTWGYVLAGLAALWNTDTGIVVAVAWTATCIFDALARNRTSWTKAVITIASHAVALVATLALWVGLYCVFAKVRSGQLPHLGELLLFQRSFYVAGFFMLPMKGWEIWQVVIAVPAVTLLLCLRQWIVRTADEHTSEKVFIALFGLGIFSFFQGRSHIHNFLPVSYPAALLGGLHFLDFVRRSARGDGPRITRGFDQIAAGLALLVPGFGLVTAAQAAPKLYADLIAAEPPPKDEHLEALLGAIRSRARGHELPIVSEVANYVHVKTGTWSPFPVSSLTEVMTTAQADKVNDVVRDKNITQLLTYSTQPPVAAHMVHERISLEQWAR